jgi:hypothetical protein
LCNHRFYFHLDYMVAGSGEKGKEADGKDKGKDVATGD